IRHGHDFPERTARDWSDREQVRIGIAIDVDRFRLGIDVDPEPMLVGPDMAAGQQQTQEGLPCSKKVTLRTGAVEEPGEAIAFQRIRTARPPADFDLTITDLAESECARQHRELTTLPHRSDPGGDLRRQPMPVDVPPWPQMAQEPRLLVETGIEPHALGIGSKLVERVPPTDFTRTLA